mmetsp:Transcript_15914/g.47807  ORF Transcript_15914/g.47807 Transcript_15914/m.47807 type:complete len:96 (+) Transcript_15914:85-372(+)
MFGILFTYMLAWLHVSAFRIVDRHATFETIAPLDSACVGEQDSPVEAKRDTAAGFTDWAYCIYCTVACNVWHTFYVYARVASRQRVPHRRSSRNF